MAKKIETTLKNFGDVDTSLLKLAQIETRIQEEESSMNRAHQAARDCFEMNTKSDREEKLRIETDIENFCTLHPEEFEKIRTRELVHGSVGFRTTPPKVTTLNRKFTWETVLELLGKFAWSKKFIREKQEIDKDAILAAYAAKEITDEKLATVSVKIDQSEKFSLAIRWEAIEQERAA